MFCTNCGKEQAGNPEYCQNCGARLVQEPVIRPVMAPAGTANYAGFWRRFAAYIIDVILVSAIFFIISTLINLKTDESENSNATITVIEYSIAIAISWLYYAIMESSSRQATLGKMALGIIVTDVQGNRISFGRATGRHFSKIISWLILLIGFMMITFTEKKQGLHDMIANTLVVMR